MYKVAIHRLIYPPLPRTQLANSTVCTPHGLSLMGSGKKFYLSRCVCVNELSIHVLVHISEARVSSRDFIRYIKDILALGTSEIKVEVAQMT